MEKNSDSQGTGQDFFLALATIYRIAWAIILFLRKSAGSVEVYLYWLLSKNPPLEKRILESVQYIYRGWWWMGQSRCLLSHYIPPPPLPGKFKTQCIYLKRSRMPKLGFTDWLMFHEISHDSDMGMKVKLRFTVCNWMSHKILVCFSTKFFFVRKYIFFL